MKVKSRKQLSKKKKKKTVRKDSLPTFCQICNKQLSFETPKNTKTCSVECRKKLRHETLKKHLKKNRKKASRYQKRRKLLVEEKGKEWNLENFWCVVCKKKFEWKRIGNKKTCSFDCSRELKNKSLKKAIKKQYFKKRLVRTIEKQPDVIIIKEKTPFRICVICNKNFYGFKGLTKTCSPECSRKYLLRSKIKRQKVYLRLKKINRNKKENEKIILLTNCKICNKSFPRKGSTKTCSSECKKVNHRIASLKSITHKRGKRYMLCVFCEKQFRKLGNDIVCSSLDCKEKRKIQKEKLYLLQHRPCKFCKKYIKKETNIKFCSETCSNNYDLKRSLENTSNCEVCKKQITIFRKKNKKTCSIQCRNRKEYIRKTKIRNKQNYNVLTSLSKQFWEEIFLIYASFHPHYVFFFF